MDIESVLNELKLNIVEYNKKELLYWISATSVLPKNEIYQTRLEFLSQLIISIKDEKFKGKTVSTEDINKILDTTSKLDRAPVEDWEPPELDKNRTFGFQGKQFCFFHGNLENPEQLIENIVVRFSKVEEDFIKNYDYSPVKEFVNLLSYQNQLIELIFSGESFSSSNKFVVPNKEFVEKWKKAIQKGSPFSPQLAKLLSTDSMREPAIEKFLGLEDSEIMKKPIIYNEVCFPVTLIQAFKQRILDDLTKISNENVKEKIVKQIRYETLNSILELVPMPSILTDFSINGSEKMDFGFMPENKIFIFKVLSDFESELVSKKVDEALSTFSLIDSEISKNKLVISNSENNIEITEKIEPFYFLITNDIAPISLIKAKTINNFITLSVSGLRDIFEDLSDNDFDLSLLVKIIRLSYSFQKKGTIIFSYNFCDFYFNFTRGGTQLWGANEMVFVDPHSWNKHFEMNLKNRPKLDITPFPKCPPYTFKTKKFTDKSYFCYNKLSGECFYFFDNGFKIFFVLEGAPYKKLDDARIAFFIISYFTYYLEYLAKKSLLNNFLKGKDKVVSIAPLSWGKENNIVGNRFRDTLFIGRNLVLFDGNKIKAPTFNLDELLRPVKMFLLDLFDQKDYELILEEIKKIHSDKKFKITRTLHPSDIEEKPHLNLPTFFDVVDVDIRLSNFLKDKFKDGMYKGENAKKLIRESYDYLCGILYEKLKMFELNRFIDYSYSESEKALLSRAYSLEAYKQSKSIEVEYDSLDYLRREEFQLNNYSPICRFLLEKSLDLKIDGKEEVNSENWKFMCSVGDYIMKLSNTLEYIKYLSEFIDMGISLNLRTPPIIKIEVNPKNNPFMERFDTFIKSVKSGPSDKLYDLNGKDPTKLIEKDFEDDTFRELDDKIEEIYGFRLIQFVLAAAKITFLSDSTGPDKLVRIKKEELVNFLMTMPIIRDKMNKEVLSNIIDFLTLNPTEEVKEVEPWRVETRERLTVKPIIRVKDILVFGIEMISLSSNLVANSIVDGNWPYKEDIDPELESILTRMRDKGSLDFEMYCFKRINAVLKISERKLCDKKNDKWLEKIKEPCPGEIDALSIDENSNLLIFWEIKRLDFKTGPREVSSQMDEFTKKDGYIDRFEKKYAFLTRNLAEILSYNKIQFNEKWKVLPVFILSGDLFPRYLLKGRENTNIILWDEIEDFIKSLSQK